MHGACRCTLLAVCGFVPPSTRLSVHPLSFRSFVRSYVLFLRLFLRSFCSFVRTLALSFVSSCVSSFVCSYVWFAHSFIRSLVRSVGRLLVRSFDRAIGRSFCSFVRLFDLFINYILPVIRCTYLQHSDLPFVFITQPTVQITRSWVLWSADPFQKMLNL